MMTATGWWQWGYSLYICWPLRLCLWNKKIVREGNVNLMARIKSSFVTMSTKSWWHRHYYTILWLSSWPFWTWWHWKWNGWQLHPQLLQIIIGQQMRDVISKVPSDHLGRGTRSQINLVLITRTTVQFVLKPRTTVRFATDTKLQF